MSTTCTGSELYAVTWSTHAIFDPFRLPALECDVIRPTSHAYVRPSETVEFRCSLTTTDTCCPVVYLVDFDDARTAQTLRTTDDVVAHAWSSAGNYSVNITALSCTNSITKIIPVRIHDVQEGEAPENVHLKAETDRSVTSPDHSVIISCEAYSPRQKSCSLDNGDQSNADVFDELTDPIYSAQHTHQYPTLGFYAVSFTCHNSFGTSSAAAVAVAAKPGVRYHDVPKGVDFVVPLVGADGSVGRALVEVDGATVTAGVRINSTHIDVSRTLLAATGEHLVVFKTAAGLTLSKKVVNVEAPINAVLLVAEKEACQVNEPLEFVVSVMEGEKMDVKLSFGDGNSENFYVKSAPLTLSRRHSYSALGWFCARLTVANALGVQQVVRCVSVERPIVSCSVTATRVKYLGNPTNFVFTVDPDVSPAMPVTVRIDYDDETRETVKLGAMKAVATPLTHAHTYSKSVIAVLTICRPTQSTTYLIHDNLSIYNRIISIIMMLN